MSDARLYISYRTPNIGDDVQTLACIAQHEHTLDLDFNRLLFIDRDRPVDPGPGHVLSVNCWYSLSRKPKGFPLSIQQRLVSVHLRYSSNNVPGPVSQWLSALQPIGCRDTHTVRVCHALGLVADFKTCPTLDIRSFHLPTYEKHHRILLVDCRAEVDGAERETHQLQPSQFDLTPGQRLEVARSKLMRYAGAAGVVTSRIHCAFPCIGMGIPVFFVPDGRDKTRFGGYEALLQHTNRKFIDTLGIAPRIAT